MKNIYLLTFLLFFSSLIKAQKDAKTQADNAYDHLSYQKAVNLYQQLNQSGLDAATKIKIADSYRLNGDTESAEYWYEKAVEETSTAEELLHYAQVLQSNGKCEAALKWYNQYRAVLEEQPPLPRAKVTDCDQLVFLAKRPLEVSNVRQINSAHLDYSPIPYQDGLLFTSTRGTHKKGIEDAWTKDNFSDIFYAEKIGNQSFNTPQLLVGHVNGNFHDGVATFNKQEQILYFSRNNNDGKSSKDVINLKIYSATLTNGKWEDITELPFNNKEYATCHPAISADGSTLYFASNRVGGFGGMDLYKSVKSGDYWSVPENLGETVNTAGNELFPFVNEDGVLFFASNGLVGIGGLDIYQTTLQNGTWSKPENLGEPLNSPKDDFGYSQLENGTEGYFTSNRTGGFGGDDIYYWTVTSLSDAAQNMITVIDESTGDRLAAATVTVAEGIYENRNAIPKGRQVKNGEVPPAEYTAYPIRFLTDKKGIVQPDIESGKTYTIVVEKAGYAPVRKVVNATELFLTPEWIVPLKKRKGLALNGTVIHPEYNRAIPNAAITLFNRCTGEYENTVSDDDGNFSFFLDCNCDYELTAKKERFLEAKKNHSTLNVDCQSAKPMATILYLNVDKPVTITEPTPPPVNVKPRSYKVGQVITLEDVYYDFNKATIRGDASAALDHIAQLLQQYPSMEIELQSHTDARGEKRYNKRLSQKRAEAAVAYIIAKGIAPHRLAGKGYGEAQLKNHCADGINCTEQEHQANRRTEIKIIRLDEAVEVRYQRE